MAVVEKTAVGTEQTPQRSAHQQILISSSLAALYVIAGFELVFMGLPVLWRALDMSAVFNEFLADALLLLVTLPTIFGLFVLGKRLEGPQPVHGMRAGAAFIIFAVVAGGWMATSGSPLWAGIGLAVLAGAGFLLLTQPGFTAWLAHTEDAGWFHATTFKPNQGLRVRRATVAALVVLAGCGIWTMIKHGSLNTPPVWLERPLFDGEPALARDAWIGTLPFGTTTFVLLFYISFNVPILLGVLAGWASWRVVNWPAFADFLIATEAEINKVSWTTRKRLYQDTIVVLVTVVLFTMFLFFVDILWIKILTWAPIDVLKHDPAAAARKNEAGAQW